VDLTFAPPASADPTLSIACLAVLAIGYLSAIIALFWTIPTGFLSEAESAGCAVLSRKPSTK
jgi:hypothetical protein